MKTVTAAHANRNFSSLLKQVASGERVLVTSRGKPVAALVPAQAAGLDPAREQARERLMAHLRNVVADGLARDWRRDDLYER